MWREKFWGDSVPFLPSLGITVEGLRWGVPNPLPLPVPFSYP